MKRILKKFTFILMLILILFSINTKVQAWSPIIDMGDDFISTGESEGKKYVDIEEESLQDVSGYLYNILLSAGVVVAVVVATVLGIQFMIGGAEGQAKVKEMLVPFIVGCVIVFGGFGIWKIALEVGNKLDSTYTHPDIQDTGSSSTDTSGDSHTSSSGATHGGGSSRH